MQLRVGTSGYAYKEWKGEGDYYPADLPAKHMLRYYGERFDTVEINNTFYRMPRTSVLEQWCEQVPSSFAFVLKASRRITHLGRLKNVEDPVAYLFETAATLGDRLGPVLFQLPPTMKVNLDRLDRLLEIVPSDASIAMEFRHPSWFDDAVYQRLAGRDAALCIADGEVEGGVPLVATASWGYLRLRETDYDEARLEDWSRRVLAQSWDRAWVFFKHEEAGTGPRLARRFVELCRRLSPR